MSDWRVLFVIGDAAAGQTGAAKRIAVISGATLIRTHDLWLALRGALAGDPSSALHAFADRAVWRRPTKELVALQRSVAEAVSSALEPVVAHHLATDDRIVVEGALVTPEFATRASYGDVAARDGRRAVLVLEDGRARPDDAPPEDGHRSDTWSAQERDAITALGAGYARWLRTQAVLRDVPIVDARPVARLAERILASIAT